MKLWRIANARYADLSGDGGLFYSARWNRKGTRMVYTAEHSALSALEVMVHFDIAADYLPDFVLMEIHAPDDLSILEIHETVQDESASQAMGTRWAATGDSVLLKVPSVLAPQSFNVLINPLHDDAGRIDVVDRHPFNFDQRLLGLFGPVPKEEDEA